MKKAVFFLAALSLTAFMGFTANAEQKESTKTKKAIECTSFVNPSRNGFNVLVIRDLLPWSYDVTVPVLTSLGATVSTATSATFPSLDFSLFNKIVVESVQDDNFYTIFQANLAKFEDFVSNGGILEVNACTYDAIINLPGGAISQKEYAEDGYLVAEGHPMLEGVPDPFYGDWANHNIITNYPVGTEILTRDMPGNNPTTVIYGIGSGFVIATGLTIEIAYYYEDNGQGYFNFGLALYPNMLGYRSWQPIPLSNWAVIIGLLLIGTFIVIRYRRLS